MHEELVKEHPSIRVPAMLAQRIPADTEPYCAIERALFVSINRQKVVQVTSATERSSNKVRIDKRHIPQQSRRELHADLRHTMPFAIGRSLVRVGEIAPPLHLRVPQRLS